jgi:putative component of toxin-antitoxin plasmid stabilization module
MPDHGEPADFANAMTELHDAFARIRAQLHVLRLAMGGLRDERDVRAQLHVLRLAMGGLRDERDVRALLSQLAAIEDELKASEDLLRRRGPTH